MSSKLSADLSACICKGRQLQRQRIARAILVGNIDHIHSCLLTTHLHTAFHKMTFSKESLCTLVFLQKSKPSKSQAEKLKELELSGLVDFTQQHARSVADPMFQLYTSTFSGQQQDILVAVG